MPTSACCSAMTSGVAMSVHFQSNHAVLDRHGERVDGFVRGQVQGLSGAEVEHRAVTRALDRAGRGIHRAIEQLAVVVRAAVLDGEQLAVAVEDPDLEILPGDETMLAGRELLGGTDVDDLAQKVRLGWSVFSLAASG